MGSNNSETTLDPKGMPVGKIRNLSISRLISGSNLISPNMHARTCST